VSWRDRPYSDQEDNTCGRPAMGAGMGLSFPRLTPVVRYLLIINVAIFIIRALMRMDWIYYWGCLSLPEVFHGQIWRVVTYQYLHSTSDAFHLLFNMIGLYFLGTALEKHWGPRQFFVFYTVAGVLGAVTYCVFVKVGWLGLAPMVGASGCVLGLLGACAVLFPNFMIILVFFPVPIRTAAAIFVAMYVLNLLSRGPNAGGDAAHLAGLAFGILWPLYGSRLSGRMQEFKTSRQAGAWERKMEQRAKEAARVDEILKKVHEKGMHSLTSREKKFLEEASRRQRMEDASRRVDQL
jgi:membrane associated rhomboid family serine protease